MNLFQTGNFKLNSGKESSWKIECDSLTDDDIAALAEMIRQMVGPFNAVIGVPRGGLRLASALRPFASGFFPCLIVDDVLTTGGSMERTKKEYARTYGHLTPVNGAVIFARGPCPSWIKPLFQMPSSLWV